MASLRTEDWDAGVGARTRHDGDEFIDLDLCETTLEGVEFDRCTFRNARFNCAVLTDVAFLNCTFVACNFFDAELTNCKLVGSSFDRCAFDLTTADGGDWSFTSLRAADLSTATLTGLRMREADLTGARGQGATLTALDLSGAQFHQADLTRADLRGSDLSSLDPTTTAIRHAVITPDQAVTIASALGLEVRVA
ncbi:pentapeptide repeat-containing protein [Actinoplanes sp. CA-131856]